MDWVPPSWTSAGDAGVAQRTPDLSPLIQEIVDRPGWAPGNSIALIITGTGHREAESFNGGFPPVLHIEISYSVSASSTGNLIIGDVDMPGHGLLEYAGGGSLTVL